MAYLRELANAATDETAWLEKKASALFDPKSKDTRHELAKQASAFANAGGGYLVFGIDKGGGLDKGLLGVVGREPAKEWVEALVPKLVHPTVIGCGARLIRDDTIHDLGHGALVIYVPLSEARPHWVADSMPQVAYLRVGAHSGPMSLLTFQDLSSRMGTAVAVIDEIDTWDFGIHANGIYLNPRATLLNGPVAELWSFVSTVHTEVGFFLPEFATNARGIGSSEIGLRSYEPMFPGSSMPVATGHFLLRLKRSITDADELEVRLSVGSARPVSRAVRIKDLQALAERRKAQKGPPTVTPVLGPTSRH